MIIKIDRIKRWFDNFRLCLCLVMIVGIALFLRVAPAYADVLNDFHNSTMTGYIVEGSATSLVENITIFTPTEKKVLGIPMDLMRYKIVLVDGKNVVDDVLFVGHIGSYDPAKNNTWHLYLRKIDEPFNTGSTGILYDAARHWLGDKAPPVYIGVGIIEGGHLMYSLIGEWEFTPGYIMFADVYMTMESWTNPDAREGKFGFRKNQDPEGKTFIELSANNISGNTYIMGGVGFTF